MYRRYRPESFSEMIGQSQVTAPLMTALRTNRVNHAYLFSGPRGCGKTTSARILARCLNCAEGPTDTPCGTCDSCVELSRQGGGSLDVVEIDAASHGGVEDARDIRERAVFAPARDRYKIFIIDEAHMVTSGGFNALLKIVEEPPEHVKFIFATTEPEKVIGTIRSRTHHYPFRLIPPADLLDYVQTLCDSEGVKTEPGVLPLAVRAGGGSARDTLSLLDQLIGGSEGNLVEYERAVGLLGFTHTALLDEVISALGGHDGSAAFAAVDRVVQTGQDPRRFVEDLLERIRDLIVVAAAGPEGASAILRGIPEDELQRMFDQSAVFGPAELSRTADVVNTTLNDMTGATSPRLHLELMVARALVPSINDAERGALTRLERLERRIGVADASAGGAISVPAHVPASQTPTTQTPTTQTPTTQTPTTQAPAQAAQNAPRDRAVADTPSQPVRSEASLPSAATAEPVVAPAAPQTEPTAPMAPTAPSAPAAHDAQRAETKPAEVPAASPSAEQGHPVQPVGPVTLEQMKDSWQQILDVLMKADRRAWMAAYTATVRDLNEDILVLSFPSTNDVTSFRGTTTGPASVSEQLRVAIQTVLGLRVRFVAKVEGAEQSAPAQQSTPAAQPAQDDAPEEPEPAGSPASPAAAVASPAPAQAPATDSAGGWPTVAIPGGSAPAVAASSASVPEDHVAPAAVSAPEGVAIPASLGRSIPEPEGDEPADDAQTPEAVRAEAPVHDQQGTAVETASMGAPSSRYGTIPDADVPPPDDEWSPPPPEEFAAAAPASSAVDWSSPAPAPNPAQALENAAEAAPAATTSQSATSAAPSAAEPAAAAPGASAAFQARVAEAAKQPVFESSRYGESVVREILGAVFLEEEKQPEENA
nr:DNA polymerase III subunit gamma and tau [Lysinibacter cavernae]